MRILIVASDPMEFPGILSHAREARRFALGTHWARQARLGEHAVLLAANGAGAARAAAAVDAAVARFEPEAVVSTGFCGALDETLQLADIVVADAIVEVVGQAVLPAAGFPPAGLKRQPRIGTVCTADHVVRTAEEKRKLFATGACAVDMEAAGAAARAQCHALPFYCIKAVTDLAGETLANDFNRALRPDGHFDTMDILGRALSRPTARIPELLRLRSRSRRAARTLGEFFADCRF